MQELESKANYKYNLRYTGVSVNGKPMDSKSMTEGSIPSTPAHQNGLEVGVVHQMAV